MAIRSDSGGLEIKYLLDMLDVGGARILEIGCGNGRLTRQYAERAESVTGIDLATEALIDGARHVPAKAVTRYLLADSMHLPFAGRCFDHAIFALVLLMN